MYRVLISGFAAVLLAGGPAGATAIKDSCVKSTNWTEKACQCLAQKAASLSPSQQEYLVAIITMDSAGAEKAQAALSVPQFAEVSTFIVNTATDCQGN